MIMFSELFPDSSSGKLLHLKRKLKKGLSLIEAAMVLALSAIVVAGVIAYYQAASDNQKTEATIAMLTNLLSVVHSTYAAQPTYDGINAEVLAKTGSLPSSMIQHLDDKTYTLHTPGGSVIDIGAGGYGDQKANQKTYFHINFSVTNNLCPIMARLDLGSSLSGFYIGSSTSEKYIKPLDVKNSEDKCTAADRSKGDKDEVNLYYEFH